MVEVKQDFDVPKGPKAFPAGHKHGLPCKCSLAAGQKKLKYVQPERAHSFRPHKIYAPPEMPLPDGTTYKMSYEAFDPKLLLANKAKPIMAKENLTMAGPFSDKTTHQMSFGAWPGVKRPLSYFPKDHKLHGEGPLSEMTTNRHDYTPKPIDTVGKIRQPNALGLSTAKMENDSVTTMSFKNPDMRQFSPAQTYKPEKTYLPPDSPLDSETVHKLSYMPWEPQAKMDMPWATKDAYEKPPIPFEGSTIYNGSYIPPGRLLEDQTGHCMGCYCLYPTECFDSAGEAPKGVTTCPDGYNPNKDEPRPPPLTQEEMDNQKE